MYTQGVGDTYLKKAPVDAYAQKDSKTLKACQEFESVFLTVLWRDMTKSSGLSGGNWDVLLSQTMGKAWANAGGIGLAKVLYNQLSKSSSKNTLGDDNLEGSLSDIP